MGLAFCSLVQDFALGGVTDLRQVLGGYDYFVVSGAYVPAHRNSTGWPFEAFEKH